MVRQVRCETKSAMPRETRIFAVIPAAGRSRRMGSPKLLLTLAGQTVIGRLLRVLDRPEIVDRIVVVRQDDGTLRDEVIRSGGTVVHPAVDPPDMRASVQCALDEIRRRHSPAADDGWLLVPADHPLLSADVLEALLVRWTSGRDRILVPAFAGRRGHPALFRWSLGDLVAGIPAGHGLNWLLEQHHSHVAELAVDDDSILLDLDTPADLAVAEQRMRSLDGSGPRIEDRDGPASRSEFNP